MVDKTASQTDTRSAGTKLPDTSAQNKGKVSTPSMAPIARATPQVMQAMGLNPSNVSPSDLNAPAVETKPMPSTNAAARALGLGETDVAPVGLTPGGVPPVAAPNPVTPETAVAEAQKVPPVGAPGPASTGAGKFRARLKTP